MTETGDNTRAWCFAHGKKIATDTDWDTYKEGTGTHLCWENPDCVTRDQAPAWLLGVYDQLVAGHAANGTPTEERTPQITDQQKAHS